MKLKTEIIIYLLITLSLLFLAVAGVSFVVASRQTCEVAA